MTETFPDIKPIYSGGKQIKTKAKIVNLGDGYEHRTLFGLPQNQSPIQLSLTFAVSESQSDIIFSFLNDRDLDQDAFFYKPIDEASALKFRCLSKTKTIPSNDRAVINLTFLQVFEP